MLIPFYTAGLVWIIAATASTYGWGHLSTIGNMVGAGITVGMGLKATYDAELAERTVGR